ELQSTLRVTGREVVDVWRDTLLATTPGRFTVAVDRDGRCVGEWALWKRSRAGTRGAITLGGFELLTYLCPREDRAKSFKAADQLDIARWLVQLACGGDDQGRGAVTLEVGDESSGVKRDRSYVDAEATCYQRLSELSAVDNGFDCWIDTTWQDVGG